jgi:opacity protein-like surface antigen
VTARGEITLFGGFVRMTKMRCVKVVAILAAAVAVAGSAAAQDLAEYDYENLSFRGVMPEVGYMWSDNVENTAVFGLKFDLGFLGPGFRLVSGLSYWDSQMAAGEVDRFETQLDGLIVEQGGTPPLGGVHLGQVDREDVSLSLDGHYVWRIPARFFFYTGLGVSGHFLNGSGPAVDGTFVEDLLDSVSAGINLNAGLEYPVKDRFRLYGSSKVEVLGDLKYVEIRFGGSLIFGGLVSGEGR